jgi:Asp-tRNA(Asn)/Glu-tRNA(Gln) amidotransferase A subunit family amidase
MGVTATALPLKLSAQGPTAAASSGVDISIDDLRSYQKAMGVSFSDDELKEILDDVKDWVKGFASVRAMPIDERTSPAIIFMPKSSRQPGEPKTGATHAFVKNEGPGTTVKVRSTGNISRPSADEDLAFMTVRELGHLVKTRQVSALELTDLAIKRLNFYGDKLLCLITLLADDARVQAMKLDEEIASGKYRGPLHGIPCGVKDLFAFHHGPTTWGAEMYENQNLSYDAAVIERLRDAGAIVVAKLSLGALAQDDHWFKGRTKNPWKPSEGSSGSSAGSASATAAGLVPFAIGTETLGSICSPSNRCRVTGLRPTFGRVSRYGAMELSCTMDKVGPICRDAEDCALVFAAIAGADPRDRCSVDRPFHYKTEIDLSRLKIGFLVGDKDNPTDTSRLRKDDYLKLLVKLGASPKPIKITPSDPALVMILEVEASSAFESCVRTGLIHELKDSSWPEAFRASRFVPGVEYLQAMRGRSLLMDSFEKEFGDYDVIVAPGVGGELLRITNLTGHPQVLIPFGVDDKGESRSVSFVGRIYEEAPLLAVAAKFQQAAGFQKLRPDLSKLG